MIRPLPLIVIAALLASPVLAASAPVPKITPVAVSQTTLEQMVRTLSSDEYEGRAPSTAGEDKTVTYLIDRFKAAGLQPGTNGEWLQEVPTVDITAKNVSSLAVTGGGKPLRFAYGTEFVSTAPSAGSTSTGSPRSARRAT